MTPEHTAVGHAAIWRGGEPVYDRGETVCVIGAGASGLAAIKNLRESGFPVDCYERETKVGGTWNLRQGHASHFAFSHINTSRPCTQFPDYPMPDDWPDFPSYTLLASYFDRYADHFGLREHIWFGTEVITVEPAEDSRGWYVTIRGQRGGTTRIMRYAAVVAANGCYGSPNMPHYEGMSTYQGDIIHSSAYSGASHFRGKRVLVIGAGNAGCEIAVEAARAAATCWHSSRRGYWYTPKYLAGRPFDQVMTHLEARRIPQRLRQSKTHRMLTSAFGDLTRFGLPPQDHNFAETHPIINSFYLDQIGHGGIIPMPDIVRFGRQNVTFRDGRVVEPDLVIAATGYRPTFGFLEPSLLGMDKSGKPRLRWHIFAPDTPTLAVVGLPQAESNALARIHWQTVLIATWLKVMGRAPDLAMRYWQKNSREDGRQYHGVKVKESPRHWFAVSHAVYLTALERAINELEAIR